MGNRRSFVPEDHLQNGILPLGMLCHVESPDEAQNVNCRSLAITIPKLPGGSLGNGTFPSGNGGGAVGSWGWAPGW